MQARSGSGIRQRKMDSPTCASSSRKKICRFRVDHNRRDFPRAPDVVWAGRARCRQSLFLCARAGPKSHNRFLRQRKRDMVKSIFVFSAVFALFCAQIAFGAEKLDPITWHGLQTYDVSALKKIADVQVGKIVGVRCHFRSKRIKHVKPNWSELPCGAIMRRIEGLLSPTSVSKWREKICLRSSHSRAILNRARR